MIYTLTTLEEDATGGFSASFLAVLSGGGDGRFASLGFGSLSSSSRARLVPAAHVVAASVTSFFGAFFPTRSASLLSLTARSPNFLFNPFSCSTEESDPLLEPWSGWRESVEVRFFLSGGGRTSSATAGNSTTDVVGPSGTTESVKMVGGSSGLGDLSPPVASSVVGNGVRTTPRPSSPTSAFFISIP